MSEAKKGKVHTPEFRAKVGLEALSHSCLGHLQDFEVCMDFLLTRRMSIQIAAANQSSDHLHSVQRYLKTDMCR